jgi:hypothetical protein
MNTVIAKHVAMLRATQERQAAIDSLARVKIKGATHRLMQAEREVFA